jgi:hypothetical protein
MNLDAKTLKKVAKQIQLNIQRLIHHNNMKLDHNNMKRYSTYTN